MSDDEVPGPDGIAPGDTRTTAPQGKTYALPNKNQAFPKQIRATIWAAIVAPNEIGIKLIKVKQKLT